MARVLAIICPNGFGHFQRSRRVMAEVLGMNSGVQLEIVCTARQRAQLADTDPLAPFADRVRWHEDLLGPAVHWSLDPEDYADGRLVNWSAALDVLALDRFDLVVSDNMSGVLEQRADALLMGSFLWSDILDSAYPGHAQVERFVQHERNLLQQHRPEMICIDGLAMPGVLARTCALPVPWMCESVLPPDTAREVLPPTVALLGNSSVIGGCDLKALADGLQQAGISVSTPPAWQIGEPFGYAPADFAACSAVICRPGIGTLTDAVATSTPVVVVHEAGNTEMTHNGIAIAALGFGLNLATADTAVVLRSLLALMQDRPTLVTMSRQIAAAKKNGLEVAAKHVLQRLEQADTDD